MCARVTGDPGPSAILRLSLPAGTYQGVNPDPWLSEGWLLNVTGSSGTFTLRINNTRASVTSYDSHLIVALNNASYNNLVSLSVNSTTISKTAFTYGTPNPYNVWNWPSGDVYPTWFADTYIFGTLYPKSYDNLIISVTFSNATAARIHFDAYGSEVTPPPPNSPGKLTHNPISGDSTVLFWPSPIEQYYLAVTSPYGTEGGQGWYTNGSIAYATLDTDLVDHGNGTRRVFLYWSGDASGTNYTQSNPILVDGNKTATAIWMTQYYLNVTSPYGVTGGSGWYNASSTAYASLNTSLVDHGNGTRRVFVSWNVDASGASYATSDPIIMNAPKTALAKWKTQYYVTVISPYGIPSGEGWYDNSSIIGVSLNTGVVDHGNDTRRIFSHWSGDGSGTDYSQSNPIHVDSPKTIIAVWKTQYYLTVTSPYGITSGEGWYNKSSTAYADLDTGMVDPGNGTRRVFTNWSGDASGTNYAQSDPIHMDGPKTAIAQWKTRYRLTTSTNYGITTPSVGQHWYDEGSVVSISATPPSVIDGEGYVWLGWTGTGTISYTGMDNPASVTMNSPINQTATWSHEYRLTMAANYGTTTPSAGDHWYEAGSIVEIRATPPSAIEGDRYLWNGWMGTGDGSYSTLDNPASITMNGPITQTASWTHQFLLTIKTSGLPSAHATKVYLDGLQVGTASDALQYTKWFNSGNSTGTIGVDDTVSGATSTRHVFEKWIEDSSTSNPREAEIMNSPKTFTALYKTQYYLSVTTNPAGLNPAPTPPSKWYDNSTDVSLTAPSESYLSSDEYDFTDWEVDGTKVSGNPIKVHMNAPHTATAYYTPTVQPLAVPVGGRSISLAKQAPTSHIAAYATLITLFGAALSLTKRKRK